MIKKISALAIVAMFFTACESTKKTESQVAPPATIENTTGSIEKAEAAVLKIEKSVNELDNLLNDIE